MTKQPLAIGIENYKEIIEKNYYYIDKSCMIKDLIEEQIASEFKRHRYLLNSDELLEDASNYFRIEIC